MERGIIYWYTGGSEDGFTGTEQNQMLASVEAWLNTK